MVLEDEKSKIKAPTDLMSVITNLFTVASHGKE